MTEQSDIRSAMLGAIYSMLPNIDDDYAAKIVYTLENKKTIVQLQQDIAQTNALLGGGSDVADTIVAKILLDEITLPAALLQLRVFNNALAIVELTEALNIPDQDAALMLNYYASFGAKSFFDAEFARVLKEIQHSEDIPDEEKARIAFNQLLKNAKEHFLEDQQLAQNNRQAVYRIADKYHLSFKLTAALLNIYSHPGAVDFEKQFESLMKKLQLIHANEHLNASLTAKVLLCQISAKDAQNITLTSQLLHGRIEENDLITIACRYLKAKTPQDILDTFDAVLTRLPHVSQKNENLALAVHVLLEGTEESFENARQQADLRRQRILLTKALHRKDLYAGYEQEIAQRFASQKTFAQIEHEMHGLLSTLPHGQDAWENKELACQVLLGKINPEEASKQAQKKRDLEIKTQTKKLIQQALNLYVGTKPEEEITAFLEHTLAPYTFWTSDPNKHLFALQTLVKELNGSSSQPVSAFVLNMLESGASTELIRDMLASRQLDISDEKQLQQWLDMYQKATVEESEK